MGRGGGTSKTRSYMYVRGEVNIYKLKAREIERFPKKYQKKKKKERKPKPKASRDAQNAPKCPPKAQTPKEKTCQKLQKIAKNCSPKLQKPNPTKAES
jgi:hypothetical protein